MNRVDSRESIRANRFPEKNTYFHSVPCERFARIASNLRFSTFNPPPRKRDSQRRGSVRSGTLKQFARIRRFARICESISRESSHLSYPKTQRSHWGILRSLLKVKKISSKIDLTSEIKRAFKAISVLEDSQGNLLLTPNTTFKDLLGSGPF